MLARSLGQKKEASEKLVTVGWKKRAPFEGLSRMGINFGKN